MEQGTLSTSQVSLDYDVAIVGGGIIGLTFAAALKDSGLKIAIIEAQPESVAVAKGRAYVISLLSGRIFQGLGIWERILPQITQFKQIQISDADFKGIVKCHPEDLGTDNLGYAAEHRVLLSALQECLNDSPNVSWLCPAEVVVADYQPDCVELEVKGVRSKIRTRLLVAADGARSRIRSAAGINTQGWAYWQSCVVATIKPEKPHNNIAYERFWSSGPMGVLPLPGNRCQVVWTAPHAEAKALSELEETEFLAELERRTGGLLGHLQLESPRYVFPVQLMQSDRYSLHRLALIGDAAHSCHPVAGQGMNLGIRDAATLAQVLQTAYAKGEDIGDLRVLKRYEGWRKLENLTILGFTDFLDRMFSNSWLPAIALRRLGLGILQQVPLVKTYALQLMTGLRGRLPELSLLKNG